MSVNRFRPHVYVIPEDDADRQIADGFVLHSSVDYRQIHVAPPAGGWRKVIEIFKDEYLRQLRENKCTHVVLLIDFDRSPEARRQEVEAEIPEDLRNRAFVVGPQENPETLRRSISCGYEAIGRSLADECDSDVLKVWLCEQVRHNEEERLRLVDIVKPFLFSSP